MKTLISFLLLFILTPCFTQGLNGELGFNNDYNQRSKGIVCIDEFSYFVKSQSYASSFFTGCSLLKIDTLENVIWEESISAGFAEYTEVYKIIPSENGGVYVLAHSVPTCDVSGDCFWFIQKFDPSGFSPWAKLFADQNCFQVDLTGLTLDANNFLSINYSYDAVSKIYEIDFNGLLTDSLDIFATQLDQINSSIIFDKIASKEDSLLGFNSSGIVTSFIHFSSPIMNYVILNDTIFVLTQDSIFSYDAAFTIIDGTNVPGYNQLSNLKISNNNLQCIYHDAASQDILTLNHQLQLLNVLSITVVLSSADNKDYNDLHFAASPDFDLTQFKAIRHLDFSVKSSINETVNWTDIGVSDFLVTQLNVSGSFWPNVYDFAIAGDVLITNYGSVVLNSCRINHVVGMSIACGYDVYSSEFSGLNIAPGNSMWISLGWMHYDQNYFTSNPITVSICIYTSHPNIKTDMLIPNDEYCEDVILGYVDITEQQLIERKLVKITDLTGREINYQTNTVMIYFYSDGTTDKIFKIE